MDIEDDLKEFLSNGQSLQYDHALTEVGIVGLHPLVNLTKGVVWVSPESGGGYYEIPAISISGRCEAYSPEYLLLWLPNEKLYGAWDCDHWVLTVFPNTTWADIVSDPVKYLNAQWEPGLVGEEFVPKSYPVKEGMPF